MSDLRLLIAELERQHADLEEQLQICIQERDFAPTKALDDAISYTKAKLTILRHLDDPDHDEKVRLRKYPATIMAHAEERIAKLKLGEESAEEFRVGFREIAHKHDPRLAELKAKKKHFHLDSNALLRCIEDLIAGSYSTFSVTFDNHEYKDDGLTVFASNLDGELNVSLRHRSDHGFLGTMFPDGRRELKAMGFDVNEGGASMTLSLAAEDPAYEMLTLFSRIAFDVFRFNANYSAILRIGE